MCTVLMRTSPKFLLSTCSSRSLTTEQCTLRHKTGGIKTSDYGRTLCPSATRWTNMVQNTSNKTSTENSQPGVFKVLSECSIWSNKVFRMQIYLYIYTVQWVHMIIQQISLRHVSIDNRHHRHRCCVLRTWTGRFQNQVNLITSTQSKRNFGGEDLSWRQI